MGGEEGWEERKGGRRGRVGGEEGWGKGTKDVFVFFF